MGADLLDEMWSQCACEKKKIFTNQENKEIGKIISKFCMKIEFCINEIWDFSYIVLNNTPSITHL